MKKVILMMLAGCFLTLSSCVKSGPVGPQGPQGADGNANVLGSDPFTVSNWALTTDNGNSTYFASFTDVDITNSVADHGIVELFLYYPSDKTWKSMPDVLGNTQFYYRFSAGGFEIYYNNVDGSAPTFPGTNTFRSVVISPSERQAHPNTNWKNYNDAMAALSATTTAPAAQ